MPRQVENQKAGDHRIMHVDEADRNPGAIKARGTQVAMRMRLGYVILGDPRQDQRRPPMPRSLATPPRARRSPAIVRLPARPICLPRCRCSE